MLQKDQNQMSPEELAVLVLLDRVYIFDGKVRSVHKPDLMSLDIILVLEELHFSLTKKLLDICINKNLGYPLDSEINLSILTNY